MHYAPLARNFEAALRDLAHAKVAVRIEAAHDLGRHGAAHEAEVVAALERALADDADPNVRAAAASVLADVGASRSVPALLGALDDEALRVQEMALSALGELARAVEEDGIPHTIGAAVDERVLPAVERCLGHEDAPLRFQAVMAFTRLCPERSRVVAALLAALGDPDARVRHIALRMAEERGDEGGAVPAEVAARAAELVADPEPLVRVAAAIVAARGGFAAGHEVLVAAATRRLETTEAADEVAAVQLCGELGLQQATAGLERRAFGWRRDPLSWHARVALAAMGHARAVGAVLRDLRSFSYTKRTLAVATAAQAGLVEALPVIEAMRGRPRRADADAVEDALEILREASRSRAKGLET